MWPQHLSCRCPKMPLGLLALALCLGAADGASAENVFGVATQRADEIFSAATLVLEGIGLLGVLGVSAMAMTGRMPWGWAFAILGALMLLKMAPDLRTWVLEMAKSPWGSSNNVADATEIAGRIQKSSKLYLYQDGRTILYVFSGIVIMALAILSMFGRFQWKWLAAVIVGIMILGSGESIISEFAGTGTINRLAIGYAVVDAETLADRTARQGQYILYGIGGIASVGLAALAMMGRFSWGWFFAITGGLLLIAGTNLGLQYIAGEEDLLGRQMPR